MTGVVSHADQGVCRLIANLAVGRPERGPDIALLKPRLQNEWECKQDTHHGSVAIKLHFHKKVSDGFVTKALLMTCWAVRVDSRIGRTELSTCAGFRVCQEKWPATMAP